MLLKDHFGQSLVNKKVHFYCDCWIGLDVTGMVVSYEIHKNEIIWTISTRGKLVQVGENSPSLKIEIL